MSNSTSKLEASAKVTEAVNELTRKAALVGVTSIKGNLCSAPGDRQGVEGASPLR